MAEINLTIAAGASVSANDSGDLGGNAPLGIWTPGAWTAAAITFQVSHDGGATWGDLFDATNGEVTIGSALIPTNAARFFALNPAQFVGFSRIRVRSGVTATPVNQVAAATLTLVTRPVA